MKVGSAQYRDGMPRAEFAAALHQQLLDCKVVVASGLDPTQEQRPFWDEVTELMGQCLLIGERVSGEKTGEKWLEIRYDPEIPNAYRHTNNPQPMHTDGSYITDAADVTFFYCVKQAPGGGATTFIDSVELLDLLEREDPALLRELQATPVTFSKAKDAKTRPIVGRDELGPVLTWNYHCVDPASSEEVKALAERFHAFLNRHVVAARRVQGVVLQPGEAIFFHDERLLHGRDAFTAPERNARFLWKAGFKFRR